MNQCSDCLHHELAQLTPEAGGGELALCYHPELLVLGVGGSSCEGNRAEGGQCGVEGRYFEAKEAGDVLDR